MLAIASQTAGPNGLKFFDFDFDFVLKKSTGT